MADEADDLDASASGINDRADTKDSRGLAQAGVVGGRELERSADREGAHSGLRNREENMQWSYGRDPEEDISFLDLLRGTDRTAAHDSPEGSDDA